MASKHKAAVAYTGTLEEAIKAHEEHKAKSAEFFGHENYSKWMRYKGDLCAEDILSKLPKDFPRKTELKRILNLLGL